MIHEFPGFARSTRSDAPRHDDVWRAGDREERLRWSLQACQAAGESMREELMGIRFPGESAEYRAARDRLLEQEIELRRAMEAVAVARRGLPPGGMVPDDYAFQGRGMDGDPVDVRLSELFAPGEDSLVIYSMMFPRDPGDERPGPEGVRRRSCPWRRARAHRAPPCSISSRVRRSTSPSASTSRSSGRRRCSAFSPSPASAAGAHCACCPRPAPPITATTSLRPRKAISGRC